MSNERRSDGWQPIETAPKDGSVLLVWDGAFVGAALWERWADNNGWWVAAVRGQSAEWNDAGYSPTLEPTHWMPLPEPPASRQDVDP